MKGLKVKKQKIDLETFIGFEGRENPILKEMHDTSDRASVIVAYTVLEIMFEKLLRAFLIESKEVEKLIDGSTSPVAPLGTGASKIKACYCLGLISIQEFQDMEAIRKIRNYFAHNLVDCTLNNSEIEALLNVTQIYKLKIQPMLERFTFTNKHKFITICIIMYSLLLKRIESTDNLKSPSNRLKLFTWDEMKDAS